MADDPPRRPRPGRAVALVVLVLVGAALLAVLALLGTAALTGHIEAALVVGGAVQAAATVGGLHRVLRHRRPRRLVVLGAAVVVVTVSAVAVVISPSVPAPAPVPVPGEASWELPSGSAIRYVHLPARGPARAAPVVFLHGGPGIADLAGAATLLGPLAADGFDVYVYDQLGAGGSSRLQDPTGYDSDRDVTDLEWIRQRIGAERMILVGHSSGGALAGLYLAAHPDHVARLVLLSPGALDPADTSANRATAGLDTTARLRTYAATLAPRALLGYLLLQAHPRAAHEYMPDAEADTRNDTVLTRAEPALHCTPAQTGGPAHASGFYRLQYPQSRTAPPRPDVRPALAGLPTPTLIIKGSCDYLSWHSALDYRAALPHSALLYLPGAGHNVQQDRPAEVLAATRAFLTDRPAPLPFDPDPAVPPDYQGPP